LNTTQKKGELFLFEQQEIEIRFLVLVERSVLISNIYSEKVLEITESP